MVSALRPGGWLLVEDDVKLHPLICPDEVRPEHQLANRVKSAFRQRLLDRGADTSLGRRLPRMFREAGLTAVQADAYFPLALPAVAVLEAANVRQVRGALVERTRDRRRRGRVPGPCIDRRTGPRHRSPRLHLGTTRSRLTGHCSSRHVLIQQHADQRASGSRLSSAL
jgi:hypothetical protein